MPLNRDEIACTLALLLSRKLGHPVRCRFDETKRAYRIADKNGVSYMPAREARRLTGSERAEQ